LEFAQNPLRHENGLIYPAQHQQLSSLINEDLEKFIESKIVQATDVYSVDEKNNTVEKIMEDGFKQEADYATYALHHTRRQAKHIDKDQMKLMFADWTA
jgi:hypothetical protein